MLDEEGASDARRTGTLRQVLRTFADRSFYGAGPERDGGVLSGDGQGLTGQLPAPPEGTRRVAVGHRVVLLEEANNKVLDVLKGVVHRTSKKPSRTTQGEGLASHD